jgi:nucleotidyltransferase substrate binding protein (TIGR01987 family)
MPGTTARSIQKLGRAIMRLGEALAEPEDSNLAIDGTIQRFEFVFELLWKTFQRLLREEGIDVATPRDAIRAAFAAAWIKDEAAWLEMLRDRNESSHTYDEEKALQIYHSVRARFPVMQAAYEEIRRLGAAHAETGGLTGSDETAAGQEA